jgi:hypothetical protein
VTALDPATLRATTPSRSARLLAEPEPHELAALV